jgi:radical SAM superfamily enzyme YgiQ (UPF0313 family)
MAKKDSVKDQAERSDTLLSVGSLTRGKRANGGQKPKRILLIDPSEIGWLGSSRAGSQPINASLLALFSYLRKGGIEDIQLLDLSLEPLPRPRNAEELAKFEDAIVELLSDYEYDVAAISCFSTFQFQSTLLVARASRRVRPDAINVVGGWHSLSDPEDFVTSDKPFDFVVSGAGDKPLLAIAQGELRPTPGETRIIREPQLSPAEHAELTYRVHEYIEAAPERYFDEFLTGKQAFLSISRGCPHQCAFCAASYEKPGWEALPVDKCLALIEENREALPGLECLYFGDALFGAQTKWRREMLKAMGDHYPDQPMALITRADLLDVKDVELLARTRTLVVLGVESLSVEMLKIMNKTRNPERYIERALELVALLRAHDVMHEVFIILDHPGETSVTLDQTCANLEKVIGGGTSITTFRYMHFPQFVRDYETNQKRFGTQFRGPLRWWNELRFWTPEMLQSMYVASRAEGESFEQAKARIDGGVTRAMEFFKPYYRTKRHGEIIGQML